MTDIDPTTNLPVLPENCHWRVKQYADKKYYLNVIETVTKKAQRVDPFTALFEYWAHFSRVPKIETTLTNWLTEIIIMFDDTKYETQTEAEAAALDKTKADGLMWKVIDRLHDPATKLSPARYFYALYTHSLTDESIRLTAERHVEKVTEKINAARRDHEAELKYLGDYPPNKIG